MTVTAIEPDLIYLAGEAAAAIRSNPRTMERWRQTGCGPAFVRLGLRRIGYRGRDLLSWLDRQTRQHTNQAA